MPCATRFDPPQTMTCGTSAAKLWGCSFLFIQQIFLSGLTATIPLTLPRQGSGDLTRCTRQEPNFSSPRPTCDAAPPNAVSTPGPCCRIVCAAVAATRPRGPPRGPRTAAAACPWGATAPRNFPAPVAKFPRVFTAVPTWPITLLATCAPFRTKLPNQPMWMCV